MKRSYEDFIWENVEYFKKIYLNRDEFFIPKGKDGSDKYYISDSALQYWAETIAQYYNPYNGDATLLKKDLLESRCGQCSNGTLYSSSRFVAELFRSEANRNALLDILGIEGDSTKFKWILEYRLKIKGLSRPAQMDLVVENDEYFVGIEAKMKEIYSSWNNDFSLSYENGSNHYLSEFNHFLKIDFSNPTPVGKRYVHRASIDGYAKCNFYYKQQICHLIGIRQKKDEIPNKKYMFLNLVFDPRDIDASERKAIELYEKNEQAISQKLKPHFNAAGIEYKGLLTQRDILHH